MTYSTTQQMELLLAVLIIAVIVIIGLLIWMWFYVVHKQQVTGPTGPSGPAFSVTSQYGIVGDNTTDQSARLNAIIEQAPPSGLGLVFSSGTYVLASPLLINKPNVSLLGLPGSTFRLLNTGNITLASSNSVISGFTVNGGRLKDPNILITGSYNTLLNVNSLNSGGAGIGLLNASFNNIANCTVTSNLGVGILLQSSPDNRLFNNLILNNGLEGIRSSDSHNGIIYSDLVVNNTDAGGAAGVRYDSVMNAVADSNIIDKNKGGSGLLYYNATSNSQGGIVTGNVVNDSGSVGVWLYFNPNGSGTNYTNVTFNLLHGNGNNTVMNDAGNVGNAVVDNLTP